MYGKWTSNHMRWYKCPTTGLHCGGVMDIFAGQVSPKRNEYIKF
jgi:hypothetical protein